MKLAVSFGDCNGIGFECFCKAIDTLSESYFFEDYVIELFGNINTAISYLEKGGLSKFKIIGDKLIIKDVGIKINNIDFESEVNFAEDRADAGKHALFSLETAINETIAKNYDGLVTLPVSKTSLNMAGWKFAGQTEMLAEKLNSNKYQMILFNEGLRVALASIHIPLKDVSSFLNEEIIINQAEILNLSLKRDFNIKHPKIAILSLNPHSGENGNIGTEELDFIIPSIEKIKKLDINVEGPFPADGFFGFGDYKKYDGILSMYHDQGLTPLKLLSGGHGVNFTANLDVIRTSPDHGTSYSKAGKNISDPKSTISAIEWCIRIIENNKKFKSIREV